MSIGSITNLSYLPPRRQQCVNVRASTIAVVTGFGPMEKLSVVVSLITEQNDYQREQAASAQAAAHQACAGLQKNLEAWEKLNAQDIPALNKQLEAFHAARLPTSKPSRPLKCN